MQRIVYRYVDVRLARLISNRRCMHFYVCIPPGRIPTVALTSQSNKAFPHSKSHQQATPKFVTRRIIHFVHGSLGGSAVLHSKPLYFRTVHPERFIPKSFIAMFHHKLLFLAGTYNTTAFPARKVLYGRFFPFLLFDSQTNRVTGVSNGKNVSHMREERVSKK